MKKRATKFLSLVLAMVMFLSLGITPAAAAEIRGSLDNDGDSEIVAPVTEETAPQEGEEATPAEEAAEEETPAPAAKGALLTETGSLNSEEVLPIEKPVELPTDPNKPVTDDPVEAEEPAEEAPAEEPAEEAPAEEPAEEAPAEEPAEEAPAEEPAEEFTVEETPAEQEKTPDPVEPVKPAEPVEEPAEEEPAQEPEEEKKLSPEYIGPAVEELKPFEGELIKPVEQLTPYPAAQFDLSTESGLKVVVDAPKGAFPEGTVMSVKDIANSEVQPLIDSSDFAGLTALVSADISFADAQGAEIQPLMPVHVSITADSIANVADPVILHISDDGVVTSVEQDAQPVAEVKAADAEVQGVAEVTDEPATLSFYANSFSKFVIGEVIIEDEEGSFDFETEEYKITVSYTKEAKIPAGTRLVVSQIEYDSEEYWDLWNQTLAKINENVPEEEEGPGSRKGLASAAFFDISLIYNGAEFEPAIPLQVEISFKHGGLTQFAGEETKIIHFGDKGTELIENVKVGKSSGLPDGMPAGIMTNDISYMQDGFSIVGVVTTDKYVDFSQVTYSSISTIDAATLLAAAGFRAAGDPSITAGKTVTDNNTDGIYELALSVQATSQQSSSASVQKSNVVMVIDVSGSMGWDVFETYQYSADTYNSNNRYYTSTSVNNNNQANGTRVYYNTQRGNWFTTQSPNNWSTPYTGTVYRAESRLVATQRAACAVVDALLAYNTNDDNITDIFEITLVKFAGTDQTSVVRYNNTNIRDQTNATLIKNAINSLTANGGTNWEAALNLALTEANYYKNTDTSQMHDPEETTSVIFLTDGFPTFYVDNNGNQGGSGNENSTNNNPVSRSYTEARPAARNIVQAGFTLYNIFAFGNDTTTHGDTSGTYNTGAHTGFQFLCGLANYAYGSGNTNNFSTTTDVANQYCFNAKSTADLVAAFQTIINHITNNVGFAGVNLSDGVSLGATSTSVAVNGTAKPESMRYTVKDETGKLAYTVKIDSSGVATFTIYNADGTTTTATDNEPSNVTTTINGTTITSPVYSVTVGEGESAKTYEMAPATIDADTGMVKWDLAGLGILESGYTYTVAFDVWPNQLAYDIAADLNNGIYADIDAALTAYNVTDETERQHIKDAIVHNADGSYSLYTNYSQSVEYYPATQHTDDDGNTTWEYGDKVGKDLPQPDPVPLKGSLLPLQKVWESDLAITELLELLWKDGVEGGEPTGYQITLYVWKADDEATLDTMVHTGITETNQPYITEVLGWDAEAEAYIFKKDVAVAPGMMLNIEEAAALGYDVTVESKLRTFTNDNGDTLTYYVIENGHYYYVTEDGSDLHFELETDLYHPMIVDGTLYNVFFGEGQTVERMDPMYAVVATNYLKGGLNISKVVSTTQIAVEDEEDDEGNVTRVIKNVNQPVDEDGIKTVTDEFTYEIKIWKEDENGTKSAVYTYDDQITTDKDGNRVTISGSIGYRIFHDPYLNDKGELKYQQDRGAVLPESSPDSALANGIYATIADGVTTITLTMPANGEIRLVNLPSGTKYTVREIVDEDSGYTYSATASSIKQAKEEGQGGEGGQDDPEAIEVVEVGIITTNTVNGTISGNKANVETYYNWASSFYVYHSATNTIEKISFADERVKGTYDAENEKYVYEFNIVEETGRSGASSEVSAYAFVEDDEILSYTFKNNVNGYLYGGYYSAFSGAKMSADQIAGKAESGNAVYEDGWATDTGATAYDANTAGVWQKAKAFTGTAGTNGGGKGTAMTPVAGTVYYLKEVPTSYLRPYIHYTYDNVDPGKPIRRMYMITATDDANYTSAGSVIDPGTSETKAETKSLLVRISKPDGSTETLTAASLFGGLTPPVTRGYLFWSDISSYIGTGLKYTPCWTTLDGVLIQGTRTRNLNNGTCAKGGTGTEIGADDADTYPTP